MGASHNIKLPNTLLSSRNSWLATLCSTRSPFPYKHRAYQTTWLGLNKSSEYTKPCGHIVTPQALYVPNHMPTLNQSTVTQFHKTTP